MYVCVCVCVCLCAPVHACVCARACMSCVHLSFVVETCTCTTLVSAQGHCQLDTPSTHCYYSSQSNELTLHRQPSGSRYGLHGVGGIALVVSPVTGLHVSDGQNAVAMVSQAGVQPDLLKVLGPTEGRPRVTSGTTDELNRLSLHGCDILRSAGEGGGN